jgi:hypothetical protein
MKPGAIISRQESLRILANDLRRVALDKRAAELNNATAEQRLKIVAQIEEEIRKELRRRARIFEPRTLLH